jgi:hypothetical protein
MGKIDFTPAVFLVGLAMVVVLFKYMGGAGGLKNIMGGLNNFISQLFTVQPVSAQPTPAPAPAPATPAPAPAPAAPAPAPAAAKTCAQRVGEVCECATCCNGDGCPGDGKGKITAKTATDDATKCVCKCDDSCAGGGGGDGDSDGGGGGDGDGNGENAEEFDEDAPAAKKQNAKIDQCKDLTGATHKACMASVARIKIRPARIARVYNWGNA